MTVRLFHRDARLVVPLRATGDGRLWVAVHRKSVDWRRVFRPALALLGLPGSGAGTALHFGTGALDWTNGPFWTTIRLRLPPCSAKKASLLAGALLKAARYADERGA